MKIFENLETKLADQTWVDAQDTEFLNDLKQVKNVVENLMVQISIFIDYFDQYVSAVHQASIFTSGPTAEDPENGKVSTSPTQTISAAGNRAERRARKTPMEVIAEKKSQ